MAVGAIVAGAGLGMGLFQYGLAGAQAEGIKAKADFEASQMEFNSRMAELEAKQVLKRKEEAISDYGSKASKMIGSQRAALAAQGIDIDSGTASDIQEETKEVVAQDIMRISNNAWREAWGYKTQAKNLSLSAMATRIGGANQSRMTLLSGGVNAIQGGIGFGKSVYGAGSSFSGS